MSTREVVLVEGVRTAFGRMGGTIRDYTCSQLGGMGIKGLLDKTKIAEKAHVDSVFLGSAIGCSNSGNPARWATLASGLGYETSASYVEMQCGSAIDSINHAAWKILANQADIIIAGGMESYSQVAVKFSMATTPFKLIPPMPIPSTLSPIAEECIGMGLTAENLQVQYNIPREAADEFAYNSQMRAKAAQDGGYFKDEIIPVTIPGTRKTPEFVFDVDEHPRAESTLEGMAKLNPVFKAGGTVTAGNSSGQNDGAAFVLMMTAEKAKELGYTPMAKWLSGADYGCDPKIMGIGPAYAMPQAIKRAGLKVSDMDVMECNEAFAVQNLAVVKEIENQTGDTVDMEKWNPMGGAIAFGHPNGASGARICIFAMRDMIRKGGRYGVFGSCCGGGLGVATVIENLQR
ncbi:MAG: thiolase family protein [Deltaproteobacteria bacterium]|jgi:acetyl-CoA acetyltransferase family protein|nr:thiolase family protein [Deltaproteobacteria bacterium]MBT4638094.1 thiolase family protein [Deltaproteobacteria bacterium]MBT6500004.1 thiolase family protein [Deltaproteobacteria bacterium]MBT6615735.1 thiolase family protein [Deltaproteobacteria bacterium]MBT7154751.1 thiolase family protein [Deltaproteobacteria bacterium]